MAEKNVQIKFNTGKSVDEIFPVTKIELVQGLPAKLDSVNDQLADIASISVLDKRFNVKTDGTNTTIAFKAVLDYAVANKLRVLVPPSTYMIASLEVPANSEIHFYTGAKMKLVANSPAWTRCFQISGVENVNITGLLEIDGNMNSILNGNEHMHGLFIYNSKNISVDKVYAHDCYGDNVSISGDSYIGTAYSENVTINNVRCFRAGRKNLVIEHVNNLSILFADLDNTTGGTGGLGGNSLDVEPFNYTGENKKFTTNLGRVVTRGTGNDFTAGTTVVNAEGCTVNINSLECHVVDLPTNDTMNSHGEKSAIFAYAVTLNINHFKAFLANTITDLGGGVFTNAASAFKCQHATRINISHAEVYGGYAGAYIGMMDLGNEIDYPIVKIDTFKVNCPDSLGVIVNRCDFIVGNYIINALKNSAIATDTVSTNIIKVNYFEVNDSCTTYLIHLSTGTAVSNASFVFENIKIKDTRTTKLLSVIASDSSAIMNIVKVGAVEGSIPLFLFLGALDPSTADMALKTLNSSILGSVVYVFADPEGKVTADKGTLAINKSGEAGGIFYLKETDSAKTGWRAL